MRCAMVQMRSGDDVSGNVAAIMAALEQASDSRADVLLLPEACLYRGDFRPEVVDAVGQGIDAIGAEAREARLPVVIGGAWTASADRCRPYNELLIIDAEGAVACRYKKVHLFRLRDSSGELIEDEAAYTTPGQQAVVAALGDRVFGLSICYDLRFPEFYRSLADAGADVLVVPANFARQTGETHWLPLLQARAIENQAWVIAPAQVGQDATGFDAFGHSAVVDPWGRVRLVAPDPTGDARDTASVFVIDLDDEPLRVARRRLQSPAHRVPSAYRGARRVDLASRLGSL